MKTVIGGLMGESLDNSIEKNAAGPAEASVDGQSVKQHSLPDQIAADKHIESKKATRKKGLGIKLVKLVPSGTNGS